MEGGQESKELFEYKLYMAFGGKVSSGKAKEREY